MIPDGRRIKQVGIILTGSLDDGTAGLLAVKRRGGIAIVQDPDEAFYSSMPLSALENVEVDYTLPLASIGPVAPTSRPIDLTKSVSCKAPTRGFNEAASFRDAVSREGKNPVGNDINDLSLALYDTLDKDEGRII